MPHGRKGRQGTQTRAGREGHRETGKGKGKETTPPLWKGRKGLSAPLKFAPYFCQNLSLCNSILQNRKVGLGNHGENTFCSQENVEKRGILGGVGLRVLVGGADVRGERTTETGRFEGLSWFGGGIVPLGGRSAKYGGF